MARIDTAIAACETVEAAGLAGKYSTWADFAQARDAAESEYRAAMAEMSIRCTVAHLQAQRLGAEAAA